jgi:hypothetical protein
LVGEAVEEHPHQALRRFRHQCRLVHLEQQSGTAGRAAAPGLHGEDRSQQFAERLLAADLVLERGEVVCGDGERRAARARARDSRMARSSSAGGDAVPFPRRNSKGTKAPDFALAHVA